MILKAQKTKSQINPKPQIPRLFEMGESATRVESALGWLHVNESPRRRDTVANTRDACATRKPRWLVLHFHLACGQKVNLSISILAETSTCSLPTMKFSGALLGALGPAD